MNCRKNRPVRPYLNDKFNADKPTTEEQEYKAEFTAPYLPGQLKAASVGGDKEIASAVLQTAGDTAKVRLSADLKKIVANGQDLSYITIAITDKDGILEPGYESNFRKEQLKRSTNQTHL